MQMPDMHNPSSTTTAAPASLFRGDPSPLILPASRGLSRQVPSPRLAHAPAGTLPSPRRSRSGRQPRTRYPYAHLQTSSILDPYPDAVDSVVLPHERAVQPPNRIVTRQPVGAYPNCRGTMSAALESLKVRFEMAAACGMRWRT
jgi:hypothetical protein